MQRKAKQIFFIVAAILFMPLAKAETPLAFEDKTGSLSPEQVTSESDTLFTPLETSRIGFSESTWWLKIRKNDAQRYLQYLDFSTTQVDLYYFDSGDLKVLRNGYSVPVSERNVVTIPLIFDLSNIDARWLYLRVKSTFTIHLEVDQLDELQYQDVLIKYSGLVGLVIGALLFLSLYNTVLWIKIRDRIYGYYLIYSFGTLLYISAKLGLFSLIEALSHLSIVIYFLGGVATYIGGFLLMKEGFVSLRSRVIERCVNVGIFIPLATMALGLTVSDSFGFELYAQYGVGFAVTALLITILVIAWRAGHPYARPIAFGWAIWVVGSLFFMAYLNAALGIEAKYALAIASLLEGTIFSMVLALRQKQVEQDLLESRLRSRQTETLLEASQRHEGELKVLVDELQLRKDKQAQIFAIIGHELRTPLSSMKMMEDAMGLRNIGEYGANICDSTDVVLNIVDDLRTVINPDKAHEAQAVVDSPFDVLSRTTRSLEGLYEQQGVEVVVSSNQLSHSLCKFNAQALRQKITNLTKNAAIHAEADTVWVDLQAQPRGDDKIDLTLIVEDDGKGIPEGLREAVFGAFSRGDTRADGTGLGLYITRELAGKLGGTVEYFESDKGGAGFKVDFTLDLHLDANEQEQAEEAIPVALQGKRILFAEDQKTLQLLTSKLLRDAGAEVVVCDNGKQALDAFRVGEFDIVLTDLMMPEMNGDELIRHIRADGFTGQVVALTAATIGKETEKLIEAGADAVLNKPLDIHAMKRTIAGLDIKDSAA